MPRKPEQPRPSRRYDPQTADIALDRLKSASAIVAPPGFGAFPLAFSLASLFARPEPGPQAFSFQVTTQQSAPSDDSAGADLAGGHSHAAGGGGGGSAAVPTVAVTPPTSTPMLPFLRATPVNDPGPLMSHSDTDTSSLGGGALPGRGSSGGASGGPRTSAGAQPFPAPGGGPAYFGASAGGAAGGTSPAGGAAGSTPTATPPAIAGPSATPTGASGSPAATVASSVPSAQSDSGRDGHPTVTDFGPQSASDTSTTPTALPSFAFGSLSFASLTLGLLGSASSSIGAGQSTTSGVLAAADDDSGGGIQSMPVGGGNGGIYGQVWRLHPATPYDAPDDGGPADSSSDSAPFNTLNALILSYIDQALSDIVPADTSGTNDADNPASLSVTGFDGLGSYAFSASAGYAIDGQYVSGSFSTTDSATLTYTFSEVGYTPDGNLFTLNDSGGGTLNIHADDGNATTHFLTNTLIGSDSYALTQALAQSATVAGSYTSAESTTNATGGRDGFTMLETQTETVDAAGSVTGGSDTYTYDEAGNDVSSFSLEGSEAISGAGGVEDDGTDSSSGGTGDGDGTGTSFLGDDTSTSGNWIGTYGAQGYDIIGSSSSLPGYATITPSGETDFTWASPTTDSRGLQTSGGSSRIAAAWYSSTSFAVDVDLTDGQVHDLELYLVDWDSPSRVEQVQVSNAATGAVLDTETISSFHSGVYLGYAVSGNIKITFTCEGGANAVLSGLFLDPATVGWGGVGTAGQILDEDTTTSGNWIGTYGAQGYDMVDSSTSLPSYATVTATGASTLVWDSPTSSTRGLQTADGSSRIAACWYSSTSFAIDVDLTDGQVHDLELYLVDWDSTSRVEQVQVSNPVTGVVLDTETVSSFQSGVYLDYAVSGDIKITFTCEGGANAVLSGLFLDPATVGLGPAGHFLDASGSDVMADGGFLAQGTETFTWTASDAETATTTEVDSNGITISGNGESDWTTTTESTSESSGEGETGTAFYTDSEGTGFGWTETAAYAANSQDQGWEQGTETDGESDDNPDGGDSSQDGESVSTTFSDSDGGQVTATLAEAGSQALSDGIITAASAGFVWQETETDSGTDWESESTNDNNWGSGTDIDAGDTESYSEGSTDSAGSTDSDVETEGSNETDTGNESLGTYGLVWSGADTVTAGGTSTDNDGSTESDLGTTTETDDDTSVGSVASETTQDSDVETDQDNAGETDTDTNTVLSDNSTLVLGAGGQVLGSSSTEIAVNGDTSTSSETTTDSDQGTDSDSMAGETDTDSYSDGDTDSVTVYNTEGDTATDVEIDAVSVGAGGAVTGGSASSSEADNSVFSSATTMETDSEDDDDSSTESTSEGGESDSDSLTSDESDTDTSTETDVDTGNETDTSSLTLGAAGVVLSGTGYDYEEDTDTTVENDTDTGSDSDQEDDDSDDDVGGNTTSDSDSTSDSDTDSSTDSDGGTESETTTENTTYGPGELVVGGTESDSDLAISSPTETISDGSSGSDTDTETDTQAEAADDETDSPDTSGSDSDTVRETDIDLVTSWEQDSDVFGAADEILGGFSTSTESDIGNDNTTDTNSSTETTTETDSSSETVGGETDTDHETDTSTETDYDTDTENDGPTDWEESSESYGAAEIVLSGLNSSSLTDASTDSDTTTDIDVDTGTETDSDDIVGGTVTSLEDNDTDTATDGSTVTETDVAIDDADDQDSQTLGLAGEIVGGSDNDVETGTDSSTSTMTAVETDTDTSTESDDETDTGDSSNDSTHEVDTDTSSSSGTSGDVSSESESMTDDLGIGGVVIDGGLTQTYSDGGTTGTDGTDPLGSTETTTETDGISQTFDDASDDESGDDVDVGKETGTDTTTETDTAASQSTGTLTEDLGVDGTVIDGEESDSESEASGDTTTEVDHPVETVTESALDVTMTLTNTATDSDTTNESDQDWAVETLGTSGTIVGGSDCFTVSSLETSGYSTTGSGPENYNDTSRTPDGTATVNASGSSSEFMYQQFGDLLGSGGDISSGSLSYTVSSSETDAPTTTESGTETNADELEGDASQAASYSVTTTMPDDATEYETGTETLGSGGTINSGLASFTWSDGDSMSRDLGLSGVSATLNINEDSTDTYGFGESGTETITTGGADAPGTVSYVWNQMGTDDYQDTQDSTSTLSSTASSTLTYTWSSLSSTWSSDGLTMTDTVSSSWHDAGADVLTSGDVLAGETDTYTWTSYQSSTDDAVDLETNSLDSIDGIWATYSGVTDSFADDGMQSESDTDSGCDTLTANLSDGGFAIVGGSNTYSESEYAEGQPTQLEVASYLYIGTLDPYIADCVTENEWDSSSEYGSYSLDQAESGGTSVSGSVSLDSVADSIGQTLTNLESWSGSDGFSDAMQGFWSQGESPGGDTDNQSVQDQISECQSYVSGTPEGYQASDSYADVSWNTYNDGDTSTGFGYFVDTTAEIPISVSWQNDFSSDNYQSLSQGGTSTHDLDGDYDYSDTEITLTSAAYLVSGDNSYGYTSGPWVNDCWELQDSPLTTTETDSDGSYSSMTAGDQPMVSTYYSESDTASSSYGTWPPSNAQVSECLSPSDPSIPMPTDAAGALADLEDTGGFAALGDDIINPASYNAPSGSPLVFHPDTSNMTATGLPSQTLGSLPFRFNDEISRESPPSPTATLIALAAAGRNPTDITLPTAGTEGTGSGSGGPGTSGSSGGPDALVAGGAGSGVAVAAGAVTLPGGSGSSTAYAAAGSGSVSSSDGSSTSAGAGTSNTTTTAGSTDSAGSTATAGSSSASTTTASSGQTASANDDGTVQAEGDPPPQQPAQGANLTPSASYVGTPPSVMREGALGAAQGAANLGNSVTDAGVGMVNLVPLLYNNTAGYIPGVQSLPYIQPPQWSENLVTNNGAPIETPETHRHSRFFGDIGVAAATAATGPKIPLGKLPLPAPQLATSAGGLRTAVAVQLAAPAGALGTAGVINQAGLGQTVLMSAGGTGSSQPPPSSGGGGPSPPRPIVNGVEVPALTVSKDANAMAREAAQVFMQNTQGWSAADKAAFWEGLAQQIEAVHSPAWVSAPMRGTNGEYVFSGGTFGIHGMVIFGDGSIGIIGKTVDVSMDFKTALVTVTRRPPP